MEEYNGCVADDESVILKTKNGSIAFVDEGTTGEQLNEFLPSQNNPNPFNPGTKIKYRTEKNGMFPAENCVRRIY